MDRRFKVLVAEENDILREKIAGLISRQKDVLVVMQVSGQEAMIEAALEGSPDLILADIRLAGPAAAALEDLRKTVRGAKLYLLSDFDGTQYEKAAAQAGADGLLQKRLLEEKIPLILDELRMSAAAPGGSCEKKRYSAVLVADDDAFFRSWLGGILTGAGIEHVVVSSGVAAVREVVNAPGYFACALLDVHMGGMNGLGAARLIRNMPDKTRILIMSSDDSAETLAEAEGVSDAAFLPKPIDAGAMLSFVRESIAARGADGAGTPLAL